MGIMSKKQQKALQSAAEKALKSYQSLGKEDNKVEHDLKTERHELRKAVAADKTNDAAKVAKAAQGNFNALELYEEEELKSEHYGMRVFDYGKKSANFLERLDDSAEDQLNDF